MTPTQILTTLGADTTMSKSDLSAAELNAILSLKEQESGFAPILTQMSPVEGE